MGEETIDKDATRAAATAFVHDAVPILGAMNIQVLEGDPGLASVLLPHAPNSNHVGTTYAGALLSVAESLGGLIGFAQGIDGFVPIVSRMEIDYLRPATTDVTATTTFDDTAQAQLRTDAERDGKACFTLAITLTDTHGIVVAQALGHYQLRRF